MITPAKSHGKPCRPWRGTRSSTPCSAWWETPSLNRYWRCWLKVWSSLFVFCVLTCGWPAINHSGLSCRSGYRWIPGLNVFTSALQHSVLVTAGFKLPIMQRSLMHEVSQVSSPCQHIYSSLCPPAMLTWSNGHCRPMLILPHGTWWLNQGFEICGCYPAYVCFPPYCQSQWSWLKSPCLRNYSFAEDRSVIDALCFSLCSNQASCIPAVE